MFTTYLKPIREKRKLFHLAIDRIPKEGLAPLPNKLVPFIWYFVKQLKWPILALIVIEGIYAANASLMFWYVGELVENANYTAATLLIGAAFLSVRFIAEFLAQVMYKLVYNPYVGNVVRHQLHWYTVRHALTFFQEDFGGRIANKLQQAGVAFRDSVRAMVGVLWFAMVFTISNIIFIANVSPWLAAPLVIYIAIYITTLCHFIPKIKHKFNLHSEDYSAYIGKLVDVFSNILPIKYMAQVEQEEQTMKGSLQQHSRSLRKALRSVGTLNVLIELQGCILIGATVWVGLWLMATDPSIGPAALAMAIPMVMQATMQSAWIMYELTGVAENLGQLEESIELLTKPHTITDRPDALELPHRHYPVSVRFNDVRFEYPKHGDNSGEAIFNHFNLHIRPGEKVGLVGQSGAGKSTLINLLLRAYDINQGQILIDDYAIDRVTQNSLRESITVVTQDSYLFHRSVLENIRYGKPAATMDEVIAAAKQAHAHDFIESLVDHKGRRGYEAHVGERGVKLSGGQKQRISIARALLKEAPIMVLDEATSALDSENEKAIQEALEDAMERKTVIAIAHRLSTLRKMDRILVLHNGAIVEDGDHNDLITRENGHYANLWQLQSGGFIQEPSQ